VRFGATPEGQPVLEAIEYLREVEERGRRLGRDEREIVHVERRVLRIGFLDEAADMLDKLPEPARTVCAVAAFIGLARSELKGLK